MSLSLRPALRVQACTVVPSFSVGAADSNTGLGFHFSQGVPVPTDTFPFFTSFFSTAYILFLSLTLLFFITEDWN